MKFTTTTGDIKILNATGSDSTYVNSAVVSDHYEGLVPPETKHHRLQEEMAMSGHWGCWHHIYVTIKIECPIFVARQIMRSSGFHFNEISGRYKELEPKFYVPEQFRTDVKRKELGTVKEPASPEDNTKAFTIYQASCLESWKSYSLMLKSGIRKEQARGVLPLCIFTEFWASATMRDWLHFLNLRTDAHAQEETRYIAELIQRHLHNVYPVTMELWEAYGKGPINELGTIQTP